MNENNQNVFLHKPNESNNYSYVNKPIKVNNTSDYYVLLVGGSSDNLKISYDAFISTGCQCMIAKNSNDAIKALLSHPIDIVILSSGFTQTLHKIRKLSTVTCLSILSDNALDIGGCDLTLRSSNDNYDKKACEKILFFVQDKRNAFEFSGATRCKNVYINMDSFDVYVNDAKLELKPMEMRAFFYLVKHKNQIIKKNIFTKAVWNHLETETSRTVDVHLMDLRKKLSQHDTGFSISTLRNVGVRLLEDDISG